jgi:hypothetical protein
MSLTAGYKNAGDDYILSAQDGELKVADSAHGIN